MKRKVYQELATLIDAVHRCKKTGNTEWEEKHLAKIEEITENYLPAGSGIDAGSAVNIEKSALHKIVIDSEYHLMDEAGFYARWIVFSVTVTPSLIWDFDLVIRGNFGRDQDVKEYLDQEFSIALSQEMEV